MRIWVILLFVWGTLHAVPLEMYERYAVALQKAKETNKPLLIYLHRRNCQACDYMENTTLSDRKVAAYLNANYIVVRLFTNDKGLPKALHAEMSPVFHFLNPQNNEMIESIIGGRNVDKFMHLLQNVYNDYKEESSGDL